MIRPAALLMAYFGAGFGALRAYPGGRTSKKRAGATGSGHRPGSAGFLKAMVKRK
jgi:hypothetical protein